MWKYNKKKLRSKTPFHETTKKCAKLTAKILTDGYKSKVVELKLDEDPLQRRFYFLSCLN